MLKQPLFKSLRKKEDIADDKTRCIPDLYHKLNKNSQTSEISAQN